MGHRHTDRHRQGLKPKGETVGITTTEAFHWAGGASETDRRLKGLGSWEGARRLGEMPTLP